MKLQLDASAVGVPDVRRPVAPVRAESFAGFTLLDLDAGLAELVEEPFDRPA